MRQKKVWWAAVPLVAALGVVWWFQPPEKVKVGPDWLPAQFVAALEKAEPGAWEVEKYGAGVSILKRRGCTDGWRALRDWAQASPRQFAAAPGRLLVARQASASALLGEDPTLLDLHPLTVRGHPDELVKIAERFSR